MQQDIELLHIQLRRSVLWITGRDLLEPTRKQWVVVELPEKHWELTFAPDGFFKVFMKTGPNVLHRLMQRFMLGIRWRMLPIKD